MLWLATLGEELIPEENVLPNQVDDLNARSEELTEVSSFHNGCPNGMGRPILNVPRNGGEVGNDVNIVFDLADDGVQALVTEIGGHGCGWGRIAKMFLCCLLLLGYLEEASQVRQNKLLVM